MQDRCITFPLQKIFLNNHALNVEGCKRKLHSCILVPSQLDPQYHQASFLISLLNFYFVKQLFQIITSILNFFLLVNDLSLGAQRKLRLQAGTPFNFLFLYLFMCLFFPPLLLLQSCVPFSQSTTIVQVFQLFSTLKDNKLYANKAWRQIRNIILNRKWKGPKVRAFIEQHIILEISRN